jgi:hypothetical protein
MWPPVYRGKIDVTTGRWGRVLVATFRQRQDACHHLPIEAGSVWPPTNRGGVHVDPCRQRQGACGHLQMHSRFMWPLYIGKVHVATFLTEARCMRPPADKGSMCLAFCRQRKVSKGRVKVATSRWRLCACGHLQQRHGEYGGLQTEARCM